MFGHFDGGVALPDRGSARRRDDPIDPCRAPSGRSAQVDPFEDDARAWPGRPEAKGDVGPVEEPVPAHLQWHGQACAARRLAFSIPYPINAMRSGEEEGRQFWSPRAPPFAGWPACWLG